MGPAHQPLGDADAVSEAQAAQGPRAAQAARRRQRPHLLALAPPLAALAFGVPLIAGLAGTLAPAFGWLPALGGHALSLDPWRALFAAPGFTTALTLTLGTGWLATLLSAALACLAVAFVHHRPWAQRLGETMAPVLAMPHSALAIGLAFLLVPSGWLVRWVSPGLSGWALPPDVSTVGHPSGWALIVGLLIKEVPYLVLMLLAALNQVPAQTQVRAARALGYGPVQAWLLVVLPQVYAQLRLPIYAVLAFSLSVVDVALILGPGNPPTLAVLAVRWFADPDTRWVFPAAAAATLLLWVVAASIVLWRVGEALLAQVVVRRAESGHRGLAAQRLAAAATAIGGVLLAAAVLAMFGLGLWSFASQWRFPAAWPSAWTLGNWERQASSLTLPVLTTLTVGALSTLIALALTLACLENDMRAGGRLGARPGAASASNAPAPLHRRSRNRSHSEWLLYLPLLVPQIAFLFGVQVLLVRAGADGRLAAVIWAHLVFVLPYLFLSLADPWRALDERYVRTALSLGASRWRVFWRIKLPILAKPVLLASAVGFAVSVGLYLPTLFAGSGRVATLTTEAVTLAAGADRRVIGTWAMLQATFPLLIYVAAAWLPRWLHRNRQGLA